MGTYDLTSHVIDITAGIKRRFLCISFWFPIQLTRKVPIVNIECYSQQRVLHDRYTLNEESTATNVGLATVTSENLNVDSYSKFKTTYSASYGIENTCEDPNRVANTNPYNLNLKITENGTEYFGDVILIPYQAQNIATTVSLLQKDFLTKDDEACLAWETPVNKPGRISCSSLVDGGADSTELSLTMSSGQLVMFCGIIVLQSADICQESDQCYSGAACFPIQSIENPENMPIASISLKYALKDDHKHFSWPEFKIPSFCPEPIQDRVPAEGFPLTSPFFIESD